MVELNKHAYLIIAHKDDLTFRTLIKLLDSKSHDLYIHMDKKLENYDPEAIENRIKDSSVFHVERTDVTWGGYSQINAELLLLKEALENHDYSFFHLLSGEDLPLKKSDHIYNFFEQHPDKNFVSFQGPALDYDDSTKVRHYHPFQDQIGRLDTYFEKFIYLTSRKTQELFKVNRNADIEFQKGTNWFSITPSLASYVVKQERFIKETFKHTRCADEIFLHTLIHNSEFKHTLYHPDYDGNLDGLMRLIDWDRGLPYTFRSSDFEELTTSPYLFARKFDASVDKEIVVALKEHLT